MVSKQDPLITYYQIA